MQYYRSDWPEKGLEVTLNRTSLPSLEANPSGVKVFERNFGRTVVRCVVVRDDFESNLYDIPIWYFFLELIHPKIDLLQNRFADIALQDAAEDTVNHFINLSPWRSGYVAAKLIQGEPLYPILVRHGFEAVENRRIFKCRIKHLRAPADPRHRNEILFQSLKHIPAGQRQSSRKQIMDCCRRIFAEGGFTRHFKDPFLLARRPGLDYILAVMALNFKQILPDHFLLAYTADASRLCGFSVIGKKAGPKGSIYSQLLSAVDPEFQAMGVYRGLTRFLKKTLPDEAELLNVTHVDNCKIQRAYQDSGRRHLADTTILRRVFAPTTQ